MPTNLYITNLILVLIGLSGYLLAQYIYRKKHEDKPFICPLKSNCDVVTSSRYSKILGIPVEILGMLYYMFIAIFHTVVIAYPPLLSPLVAQVSMAISGLAFLFSLYLISIQAFVIKQWCTWCLCSAFLCAAIFLETYVATPSLALPEFLKSLVF